MVDQQHRSHGTQPPPSSTDRGHPLPRRTSPEKSVTLRSYRLAPDATMKASPHAAGATELSSSLRRNSSGESHDTGHSDPKKWFDRSNRNPTATFDDANNMDIDPPFFQKESDSSNDEPREQNSAHPYAQGARVPPRLRHTVTHSSSADDYRSVIDDLTIENKRLKEELKRYKQFGPDMLRKEKLFEIKVHGLARRKKRELEATLRDFAASLEGSSEAPSQRRKPGRHVKNLYSSGESMSKHASSSSSHSRPLDSAYASMSTGPSSAAPNSSGPSLGRPSTGSRAKSSSEKKVENYIEDTPVGLLPRHMTMTDKERKRLVVRRLEQLFTGKIGGRNVHRNQSMPPFEAPGLTESVAMAPPQNRDGTREARIIQPHDPPGKKTRSRDNLSTSNSNGDQTESAGGHGVGDGSGSGSRSGNNPSPYGAPPPEQRPTRPRDLDPDRAQVPSENMEYIRHLGLVPPEFLVGKKPQRQDVSPDAEGWVYLNLLCNLAQLHMINVTPSFIRHAVSEMSTKFQLSPDGRKIRWRGGSHGTKFSSDSSGDNSHKSPSNDGTDESNEGGQRKKQKTGASGDALTSAPSTSKESKFGPQVTGSSDSFHYKPLFVHHSSSMETSLDDTGSQASFGAVEDSNPGNTSRWDFSGSGSSQRKKRRHDGAIIYYSGAPFCTDLSGDPGEMSPTTYMTSTGQERELDLQAFQPVLQRSLSGSLLPIRPLSDDRAIVSEALDMDLDNPPDRVTDEGDSANDEDFELPWCDDPETVIFHPLEPPLEPCGLGGVVPEDHFAVVVTTRRPIAKLEMSRQNRGFRARSEDVTDSIAGRLASMTTSSPAPFQKYGEPAIEIEYLSGKMRRFKPIELPPPAVFIPPFSTDSDTDGDDLLGSDEEDESEGLSSEGLISQRANPHHSDNTYPGGADSSSNDEEHEVDADNEAGELALRSGFSVGFGRRRLNSGRRVTSGSTAVTGRRPDVPHTGSSAATAGGAESGYNSSMEDDAQ